MMVDLQTLGRLAVFVDGREVAGITAQPVRAAVLVYLAVERAATRDAVLACIWPDADPASVRHTLSQTLYQLRRDLGESWLDAAGNYVRATPDLTTDAVRFGDALDAGQYPEALALYRAAFLDGCHLVGSTNFESWVDRHRGRLARLHRRARREYIERLVAAGDQAGAMATARGWVEVEPFEDEAQQYLMRLLAESGAAAAAISQYTEFTRLLAFEDLEPLPETTALAAELRRSPISLPWATRTAPESPPTVAATTTPPRAGRRRTFLALAGAGVALMAVVGVLLRNRAENVTIRSVAVLPFDNLGGDSADAYFVDGIHEALIADLSRVSDLRVISRTSASRYRGSTQSVPEIAGELGVDAVIEGSVLKAGDSVRIQASLIAAADQTVSTVTYVAALENILTLLRDVARRIAGELTAVAGGFRDTAPAEGLPVLPAAYEAYLRARHLQYDLPSADWPTAERLYREAIGLDSTFAMAQAGLANVQFLNGFFGAQPRDSVWRSARNTALRALELDDRLAEAHTVLGYIALYGDWDWPGAERSLLRALRLNPNDALARHGYADLLTLLGRPDEGLRQMELGRDAEPLSPLVSASLLAHRYLARRYEEVIADIEPFREVTRSSGFGQSILAAALWQLGRRQEALAEYRRAWTNPKLLEATVRGEATGGPAGALHAAADQGATSPAPDAYGVAALYARAGDPDAAFVWLERTLAGRGPSALHAVMDPAFDPLRQDPRFPTLLRRFGFPPNEDRLTPR